MTPRQRYIENRQRKQNITFSVTASVMAVLLILSLLTVLGVLNLPIGTTFAKSPQYANEGDIPCPVADAQPGDPAQITVRVLNGTETQGLAGDVTQMLKDAGFQTLDPQNAVTDSPVAAEIDAGPRGVNNAYTVAKFFPNSRVTLTDATDMSVTVLVGTFYDGVLDETALKQAVADIKQPLTGQQGCLPVDPDARVLQLQSGGSQSGQSAQSGQSSQQSGAAESGQ